MFHVKVQTQMVIFPVVTDIFVRPKFIDSTQPQWNIEGTFCWVTEFLKGFRWNETTLMFCIISAMEATYKTTRIMTLFIYGKTFSICRSGKIPPDFQGFLNWCFADESAATLDFDIDNQNSFWFLTQKEKEEDIKVEWW